MQPTRGLVADFDPLRILGDPSRLRVFLALVRGGERRVTDVAEEAELSLSMASRHLTALEEAGLVVRRAEGRERFVRVPGRRIAALLRRLADTLERCCP
jgi:DNA-binding transcriptional ArsR family regulator